MKTRFTWIASALVAVGILLSPLAALAQPKADSTEISFWESARDSGDTELIEAYLDTYPDGAFRELANILLKKAHTASSSALAAAVEQCDLLAANAADPGSVGPGVQFAALQKRAKEAIAACQTASNSGDLRHSYQLFRAYLADERGAEGIKYLLNASEKGYIFARNWHANYSLEAAFGLPQDGQLAIKLHKMNIEAGWAQAHFALGRIYRNEDKLSDVERDYEAAFDQFMQGVNKGVTDNLFFVGWAFEFGQGVEANRASAMRYYRQSLEQTNYRRDQIRERLANLIRIELDEERISSPENFTRFTKAVSEYKNLFAARRSNIANHTDYVAATGWILWQATSSAISYRSAKNFKHNPYGEIDADTIDRLFKMALKDFEAAIADRAKAYPDVFPEQKDNGFAPIAAEYLTRLNKIGEGLDRHFREATIMEDTSAADCIKSDTDWDRNFFETEFTNRCELSVIVIADLKVTYTNRSGVTTDTDRLVIAAGKRKTARVESEYTTGKSQGSVSWVACYEAQGNPEKLPEKNFRCGAVPAWTAPASYNTNRSWMIDTINAQAMKDRK